MILKLELKLGKRFNLNLVLMFGSKTKRVTIYIGR